MLLCQKLINHRCVGLFWHLFLYQNYVTLITVALPDLWEGYAFNFGHGTTNWFQIGKGVHQGCILSRCLFNFCAEYTMRNAGLEEAQVTIKIARRNINSLRYADDTTLMAESEEELKGLKGFFQPRVSHDVLCVEVK